MPVEIQLWNVKTVAIVQSNYLPWKGYFDLIRQADVFVLYDDVQFTKRDWRNRNVIKTPQGLHWLTVPVQVKGRYDQLVKDVVVSDPGWPLQHWRTIEMSYRQASGFSVHGEWLKECLLACQGMARLSEINGFLIGHIAHRLGLTTPLVRSEDIGRVEGRSENLLHLCTELGATDYLSGPAARDYLDVDQFARHGVTVHFAQYGGYPEFPQLHGPFKHEVSIVDLLLSVGSDAPAYIQRQ